MTFEYPNWFLADRVLQVKVTVKPPETGVPTFAPLEWTPPRLC